MVTDNRGHNDLMSIRRQPKLNLYNTLLTKLKTNNMEQAIAIGKRHKLMHHALARDWFGFLDRNSNDSKNSPPAVKLWGGTDYIRGRMIHPTMDATTI